MFYVDSREEIKYEIKLYLEDHLSDETISNYNHVTHRGAQ